MESKGKQEDTRCKHSYMYNDSMSLITAASSTPFKKISCCSFHFSEACGISLVHSFVITHVTSMSLNHASI